MIPSYQEEIRVRKNKDRIFWLIVAIMTVFLYFFFQGYYPNYERLFDRTDTSKQAFLKPFGIIDIHVFPSPDVILINDEKYNNNSKTIFDLGTYRVSIQKKGYLPVVFPLDINSKSPFYTNVVNLFALPEYSRLPLSFNKLSPYGDSFLLHTSETGTLLLVDTDFTILQRISTQYTHIGGLYFTDGMHVLTYSIDGDKFTILTDRETGLPLQCSRISYYQDKLFCHDVMQFIGPKTPDIREKILTINENVVVTPQYIYNQDNVNATWKYFEYQSGALHFPESVIRINKVPYFLEKGNLLRLDLSNNGTIAGKIPDWGMDTLSQVQEIENEAIILGQKNGQGKFRIIDNEKKYDGVFDFENTKDVGVHKVNGVYVFTTPNAVYVYYKGAKEIAKILEGVRVLGIVDAKVYFNKDDESYVIDLLRKAVK